MFYRTVEAEPGSSIFVDGMDVLRLPLKQLRRAIAIVPQVIILRL